MKKVGPVEFEGGKGWGPEGEKTSDQPTAPRGESGEKGEGTKNPQQRRYD